MADTTFSPSMHCNPALLLCSQDFNYSARDKSGINMDCLPTREVRVQGVSG